MFQTWFVFFFYLFIFFENWKFHRNKAFSKFCSKLSKIRGFLEFFSSCLRIRWKFFSWGGFLVYYVVFVGRLDFPDLFMCFDRYLEMLIKEKMWRTVLEFNLCFQEFFDLQFQFYSHMSLFHRRTESVNYLNFLWFSVCGIFFVMVRTLKCA